MTVLNKEVTANYVPAAAVKRRSQALSGITGCKGSAGGRRTPQGYTKKYPLLFPTDSADSAKSTVQTASGSADTSLSALPKDLFTKMCSVKGTADSGSGSNRYFLWTDQTTFKSTVTEERLSLMRSNFNPAVYGTIASYYNMADQYLGRNVQYAKLTLDAQ